MPSNTIFSIITPSYNMLPYLKRCVLSVQDQQNVPLEHIVVDGLSSDGTVKWLRDNKRLKNIIEDDQGMYDALNKGLKVAKGNIVAYLNCDEQYLPGTLAWVKNYFEHHPEVDLIFGDAYLIKPDGSLVAFRKGSQPRRLFILASHLYVLSCTMFFRKKILEAGHLFNPQYKCIGDEEFVVRLLQKKYIIKHVQKYLAVYTITGKNLSRNVQAGHEKIKLLQQTPYFPANMAWLLNIARLMEKFFQGAYYQKKPVEYSIYTNEDQQDRKKIRAQQASFKWRYD
ncbi:glycosyltransferase family 2 protein [candidate division CSSED10-310 bacterium]|uniref:Glycosyltransferase family 2 protein n=1 Tax=candidate division CSSED10-310 bacterium TaxID=2855610 RepID=A0ABV6YRQ3_UNCC1